MRVTSDYFAPRVGEEGGSDCGRRRRSFAASHDTPACVRLLHDSHRAILAAMKPSDPPLRGLRVLELARILAGPWIGQCLADLGADVIKVESPEGDETRRWGPPFVRHADGSQGDAAYFHACNRGKRSVVADLRKPADRDFVRALAKDADVLIENFKVGGAAKYGLGYENLDALNPRLVYCSVTGFGQSGPYAERPGYDAMIQAMSGIMDLTGEPDGPPQKIGVAFADIFTGLYGVIAIQAALAQRARTGLGQHVDLALLDCMIGVLADQNLNYLISGVAPRRLGTAHPNIVPYQGVPGSRWPYHCWLSAMMLNSESSATFCGTPHGGGSAVSDQRSTR